MPSAQFWDQFLFCLISEEVRKNSGCCGRFVHLLCSTRHLPYNLSLARLGICGLDSIRLRLILVCRWFWSSKSDIFVSPVGSKTNKKLNVETIRYLLLSLRIKTPVKKSCVVNDKSWCRLCGVFGGAAHWRLMERSSGPCHLPTRLAFECWLGVLSVKQQHETWMSSLSSQITLTMAPCSAPCFVFSQGNLWSTGEHSSLNRNGKSLSVPICWPSSVRFHWA